MHHLAAERGGRFLSTQYQGSNHRHEWQCGDGHRFSASPANVKTGRWCPECFDQQRGVRIKLALHRQLGIRHLDPKWSVEEFFQQRGVFLLRDVARHLDTSFFVLQSLAKERGIDVDGPNGGVWLNGQNWLLELPDALPLLESLVDVPSLCGSE